MEFTCPNCATVYYVDDDQVRHRLIRVRCRRCQSLFHLRGPSSSGRVSTLPPHVAQADPRQLPWYYALNGRIIGPIALDALAHGFAKGLIPAQSLVWSELYPQWMEPGAVAALRAAMRGDASPPPVPPPPPSAPAKTPAQPPDPHSSPEASNGAPPEIAVVADAEEEPERLVIGSIRLDKQWRYVDAFGRAGPAAPAPDHHAVEVETEPNGGGELDNADTQEMETVNADDGARRSFRVGGLLRRWWFLLACGAVGMLLAWWLLGAGDARGRAKSEAREAPPVERPVLESRARLNLDGGDDARDC